MGWDTGSETGGLIGLFFSVFYEALGTNGGRGGWNSWSNRRDGAWGGAGRSLPPDSHIYGHYRRHVSL